MKKLFLNILKPFVSTNFLIVLTVIFVVLVSQKYLGADNIVEEVGEVFIEEETGVKVDLSPESIEEIVEEEKELFKFLSKNKLLH